MMPSPFAAFAPLNDLIRRQPLPLVSRTVVIGGVALLDWDVQQSARFGAEVWGSTSRTTEDIDIVIAASDDRGWLEALTHAGWGRDPVKSYRWRPPATGTPTTCVVDLLGQYGGDAEAGGQAIRLQDYWGGEDGAYICRVLRAYQGRNQFPSMLTESFWDPYMQGFQWIRLNHLGLALSKLSAIGIVLRDGDSEHLRGATPVSRLAKDAQDAVRLLRDEVAGTIAGWHGQAVIDQLVPPLVTEVMEHLETIRAVTAGQRHTPHLQPACRPVLEDLVGRLPRWRAPRTS
jgi:hypothetical protein